MPTFDTPQPIAVSLELGAGDVRITAADRTDTVVEVRPRDPARQSDVTAAAQTRVEYDNGVLRIKAPRSGWKQYPFKGGADAIDVHIELPAGSTLRGETAMVALRVTGRLGECRYKAAAGEVRIDETGPVTIKTAAADLWLGRVTGHCDIATASGSMQIGTIDGPAAIRTSNGDTTIGEVTGDLRVSAANGKISIHRAGATVAAKTANGDIRLGEVAHGAVVAQTAYGRIDVGVRDGVAAWLDLQTGFGKVHSDLNAAERPAPGEHVVELKARTAYGDINVQRAVAHPVSG